MKDVNSEKLSLGTKIGFGMGDIFGGGSMAFVGLYYLYFLTDIVKLSPAMAGIVFLIAKIWDAVNDPLMGVITDRTRSRFGRRRPYLLAGIVFVFAANVMLWYPLDAESELARFAFALFGYLFFDTVLTMVMIPYNALASELTLNYQERTSLTSVRMFFSMGASIVCAVVPMEIVKAVPDVREGHVVMGVTFGLLFALPYIATFFTTRERTEFQKEAPPFSWRETYLAPFKIRSFVLVLLMYLFSFLSMDVVMSIIIYFMTYYLGRGNESNYVFGTMLIVQMFAIPLYYYVSRRTSKKTGLVAALASWLVIMLFSVFIKPGQHPALIYVFAALVGFSTSGVVVMIYSMFPDVPDVDELVSGERREGTYMGMFVFMRKLSSAFAIFIISQAISFAGYLPPVSETADGAVKTVNQAQPELFITILRVIFAAAPAVFLLAGLYAASRYRLSPEVHGRLKNFLIARRGGAAPEDQAAEEAELRKILV
jgi:oligogalacturonide transporter